MIGFVTIKKGVHLRADTITSVRVLPNNSILVRWIESRFANSYVVYFDSEKLANQECVRIMAAINMHLDRALL